MRRLAIAFGAGLGVGLLITAVRVVLRARKGLPTALGPSAPGGPGRPVDVVVALAERVRSAFAEGAIAMKETDADLRSKVLDGGS